MSRAASAPPTGCWWNARAKAGPRTTRRSRSTGPARRRAAWSPCALPPGRAAGWSGIPSSAWRPEGMAEGQAGGGWLKRLAAGLKRSSSRLGEGIAAILTKRRLDAATLGELEELLIAADLGPATAKALVAEMARDRFGKDVSDREVREALAAAIAAILAPAARPLRPDPLHKPHVVLVVGVNGSGKTTTIGKLATLLKAEGRRVMLVAGDTFRAAAVEQLKIWGERAGCPVIAGPPNADAAGLAFGALEQARRDGADVLLIDTAGRLHNKSDLMAQLQKLVRVLAKLDPTAPHQVLLVLDAGIGQNALQQVEAFKEMVAVTGLVVTKLDGTARGGVLVALVERFGLPVHAIGVGEGADDLRPFDALEFARALLGLAE
ncbi:MAG: signal recognition particle-docking protein FtsY [Alphaproteobacteria bacterium]|nr:signal recognition particle-docking protein FtsY [Alphaproteobacteria bacterium]